MLRIAICDDRPEQLALIRAALRAYFDPRGETPEVSAFDNSLLFLENLAQTGGWDIVLLDICMPGILGTDVAREIRQRRDKTEIVFLTASDEYAVDAFALKAAHYLMKPFTQAQFDEAMGRATARFENGRVKNLVVKPEGGGAQMVDIGDILYIESRRHVLTVHTKTGDLTEGRRSLSRMLEELEALSPGQFIMPYKGYVVNQRAVTAIEPEQLLLRGGARVPIPRRSYREIQNRYFDYLFPKNGGTK